MPTRAQVTGVLAIALVAACRQGGAIPADQPGHSAPTVVPQARFVCPAMVSGQQGGVVVRLVDLPAGVGIDALSVDAGQLQTATGPAMVLSAHAASALGLGVGGEAIALWTAADGALSNELFTVTAVLTLPGPLGGLDAAFTSLDVEAGCLGAQVDDAGIPLLVADRIGESVVLPGVGRLGSCAVLGSTASAQEAMQLIEIQAAAVDDSALLAPLAVEGRCLMGEALAARLELGLGAKLVLMGFDADGELVSRLVRVGGLVDEEVVIAVRSERALCP